MSFRKSFTKNIKKYQFSILFIFLISITFANPVYGFHNETEITINEDSWLLSIFLIIFFVLLVVQKKINLLEKIHSNNILKFNLSKKIGILIVIVTLGIYISFTYYEIFEDEYEIAGADYEDLARGVDEREISTFIKIPTSYVVFDIRGFVLKLSIEIFDNIRFIPFVISISLLILVYFLTLKITNNVIASLLSFFLLIQNPLFLKYDTIATYSNTWIFFYFLSLFLISKKTWPASPIFFILGVYTKAIAVIFFPVNILFALQSRKKFKKKIFLIYGSIILLGVILVSRIGIGHSLNTWDFEEFVSGFFALAKINQDPLFLILLVPVIIMMYIFAEKGLPYANAIMLGILLSLLSQPLLVSVTPAFAIHDYRFMPFSVFFTIGIGLLLSKTQRIIPTKNEKIINKIIFVALILVSSLTLLPIYLPQFAHQVIKMQFMS